MPGAIPRRPPQPAADDNMRAGSPGGTGGQAKERACCGDTRPASCPFPAHQEPEEASQALLEPCARQRRRRRARCPHLRLGSQLPALAPAMLPRSSQPGCPRDQARRCFHTARFFPPVRERDLQKQQKVNENVSGQAAAGPLRGQHQQAASCQPHRTWAGHISLTPSQKSPASPERCFFLPVLKWFGVKKTDGYGTWPVLPRIGVGLQHVGDSFCISEAPAGKQEAS